MNHEILCSYIFHIQRENLKKEKKIHHILKSINFSKLADDGVINFLKREADIDIKKEIPYFKKQIEQYQTFDTTKFSVKKIRYLPRPKNLKDTLKYMDYKYAKYAFGLSKPVFTRNGNYAIIDYYSGGAYILVFKKVNNIWKEQSKYLILRY